MSVTPSTQTLSDLTPIVEKLAAEFGYSTYGAAVYLHFRREGRKPADGISLILSSSEISKNDSRELEDLLRSRLQMYSGT